jgi:hypothetical protein
MDSDNVSSQDEEEDWDFEEEDFEADEGAQSLFEDLRLPNIGAALQNDIEVHGFDFQRFRIQVDLNFSEQNLTKISNDNVRLAGLAEAIYFIEYLILARPTAAVHLSPKLVK